MLRPWHHTLTLDRTSLQTIHQQLTQHFRHMIRHGEWLADSPLPSTREIAQQLGINRKTVAGVYEELLAHGLIYTQAKRGSFIAKQPTHPLHADNISSTPVSTDETPLIQSLIQTTLLRYTRRAVLHLHKLKASDYDQRGLHHLRLMLANHLTCEKKLLISPQQLACSTWLALQHRLLRLLQERNAVVFTDDPEVYDWLQQQGITAYSDSMGETCAPDILVAQIEKYCINYPVDTLWLSAAALKRGKHEKLAQRIQNFGLLLIEDLRQHAGNQLTPDTLAAHLPQQTIVLGSLYGRYCDMFNLYYLAAPTALTPALLTELDSQHQQSLLLNMMAHAELLKRGDYKKLMRRIVQLEMAQTGYIHPA